MTYAFYLEKDPSVKPFIDALHEDDAVRSANPEELKLRDDYRSKGHPKTLYDSVRDVLGIDFHSSLDHPAYRFFQERLSHVFIRSRPVDDQVWSQAFAERMVCLARTYIDTIASLYGTSPPHDIPRRFLEEIVAWTDSPSYNSILPSPKLVVTDSDPGVGFLRRLMDGADEDAKIFMYGDKDDIGDSLISLIRRNIDQGYPFRTIAERGCWSIEFFTGEYVRKVGFSPHQNALMAYLKEGGRRPFCRIVEAEGKWLIKLDLGQEGWNPED